MSEKVEKTYKERNKCIKKDREETKKRHETVNVKLWIQETRMDTMGRDQAENYKVIQFRLYALLRNSNTQERWYWRVRRGDPVQGGLCGTTSQEKEMYSNASDPECHRIRKDKTEIKGGWLNSTSKPRELNILTSVAPDAMTGGNNWEMINRTLEAFVPRNT